MDFFFIDDARQRSPSRVGMHDVLAIGGICVPESSLRDIEKNLGSLCEEYHFPPGEMFKWSPGRELWMHQNLIGDERKEFLVKAINLADESGIKAIVVIEDTQYRTATGASTHELDSLKLFLERAHGLLRTNQTVGMVIASQPTGDRKDENKFLADCLETLSTGTDYVEFERIAIGILSYPPKYCRILQLADIVASCTTAYISGESTYAPPIFNELLRLFIKDGTRVGGLGVKIHPDNVYCNLYHWLLGDETLRKGSSGYPLPYPGMLYDKGLD